MIVIGAGLAGLAAALQLDAAGWDVSILEARFRPGGRVYTLREPFSHRLYADAGAARIQDTHEYTLSYVKQFKPHAGSVLADRGQHGHVGHDLARMSALQFLRDAALGANTRQWFKIRGGNDRLPAALAARLSDKSCTAPRSSGSRRMTRRFASPTSAIARRLTSAATT